MHSFHLQSSKESVSKESLNRMFIRDLLNAEVHHVTASNPLAQSCAPLDFFLQGCFWKDIPLSSQLGFESKESNICRNE